jgi:hypothetical protein
MFSCNGDFILQLSEPDDKIVVEGWIDGGQYAKVLLTRNSPYFSSIDSASLRDLVLTTAKVTLTDGGKSEMLILRRNNNYFPPYIFEGNEIKGETGKVYTLTAEYGGKTAWATTTIPPKVNLDTLFFTLNEDSDSLGSIHLEFTDPPENKNFYRVLVKCGSKDKRYLSPMIMALDDNLFSGQTFGFSVSRGPESLLSSHGNKYFQIGDTVGIKFCSIDKAHYEFWSTFQDEVMNTSNPFASSLSGIFSNIQGDGLGVWGGYGVSFYTLIIK